MASYLDSKINSYAIQTGIELDYAYSLPPTQTGTVTDTDAADWAITGVAPYHDPYVGPPGGYGSWQFLSNYSTGRSSRLRATAGNAILASFNDYDYSVGFWVNISNFDSGSGSSNIIFQTATATQAGFAISIDSNGDFVFLCGSLTTTYTPSLNTWYFISIIRSGGTATFYVNNTSVLTGSSTDTGTAGAFLIGPTSISTITANISNVYIAPTSVIGTTEQTAIYNAGIYQRVLKHWTGSAWVNSTDQKIYNGTSWVKWRNPKHWDGSAWIPF